MPTTLDATKYLQENGVLFCPGKAANAGGVATSALEMTQNSERLSWSFEEVDSKLKTIMVNIFHNLDDAAREYGFEGNWAYSFTGLAKYRDQGTEIKYTVKEVLDEGARVSGPSSATWLCPALLRMSC